MSPPDNLRSVPPPAGASDRQPELINNSQLSYIPVRLKCGLYTRCRPDVLSQCPSILEDLNSDLHDCLQILPRSVRPLIRRTKIWVNFSYCVGYTDKPKFLNHATTHHHEAWLLWAKDRPEKTLGIEIYNCVDYQRMRLHWNGCGLMLHELCHLIHQHALSEGLENAQVKQAFATAGKSDLYEQVLRRDWAGKDVDCDMAYAIVDHREFFAEMSVAYWSRAYHELDQENHSKMEKTSPPILETAVKARVAKQGIVTTDSSFRGGVLERLMSIGGRTRTKWPHCNKFYPFTRGQLQQYDRRTFQAIDRLWNEISMWEDPYLFGQRDCFTGCWYPRISKTPKPAFVVPKHSDLVDL